MDHSQFTLIPFSTWQLLQPVLHPLKYPITHVVFHIIPLSDIFSQHLPEGYEYRF
jgi:hypothetical protein